MTQVYLKKDFVKKFENKMNFTEMSGFFMKFNLEFDAV